MPFSKFELDLLADAWEQMKSAEDRLSVFRKLRNTPLNNEGWFEWELYYHLLKKDRGWKKEKKRRIKNRQRGNGVDLQFQNHFIELRVVTTEKTNMSWVLQGLKDHPDADAVLFLALYHKNLRKWLERKRISSNKIRHKDKIYEILIRPVNEEWVVGLIKLGDNEKWCRQINRNMSFSDYYYFEDKRYSKYAIECKNLLNKLSELGIYETRKHKGNYVCWYVGFKDVHEEKICFILHFNILKSKFRIVFRFHNYAPKHKLKSYTWELADKWISIPHDDYSEEELIEIIDDYLRAVKENWGKIEKSVKKEDHVKIRKSVNKASSTPFRF